MQVVWILEDPLLAMCSSLLEWLSLEDRVSKMARLYLPLRQSILLSLMPARKPYG